MKFTSCQCKDWRTEEVIFSRCVHHGLVCETSQERCTVCGLTKAGFAGSWYYGEWRVRRGEPDPLPFGECCHRLHSVKQGLYFPARW